MDKNKPYIFIFPDGSRKMVITNGQDTYRWPICEPETKYEISRYCADRLEKYLDFRLIEFRYQAASRGFYVCAGSESSRYDNSHILDTIINAGFQTIKTKWYWF